MSNADHSHQSLPPFTTARLLLRPFTSADAADAFAISGDDDVMRYGPAPADPDVAATAARVQRYAQRTAEAGFAPWAIVERRTEHVVGLCGLMRVKATDEIELAYRLRRDRWGKGIATEAATAWLDRGFLSFHLPRIVAFVDPANTASLRVLTKIGMRFVGDADYAGLPLRKFEIANPAPIR